MLSSTRRDGLIHICNYKSSLALCFILLWQVQLVVVVGLGVHSGKEQIIHKKSTIASVQCRREVVKKSFLSLIGAAFTSVQCADAAFADDDKGLPSIKKMTPKKPFAPAPALLPAARVKFTIDESIRLVEELIALGEGGGSTVRRNDIVKFLTGTLVGVKSFMVAPSLAAEGSKKSTAAVPIDESIMTPSKSKLYQETYNDKLKDISPIDVPYALLSKVGDYRQFDQLQRRQRKLEKLNPIRQAFNYYTRQLQFDTEYYVLNANAEEKKRMIRNDALPDIKSVIVSDLDLRDLVRNQVLDAYDDVTAELQYQVKNYESVDGVFDGYELMEVLNRAKNECDKWFSFISEDDVKQAMEAVVKEQSVV